MESNYWLWHVEVNLFLELRSLKVQLGSQLVQRVVQFGETLGSVCLEALSLPTIPFCCMLIFSYLLQVTPRNTNTQREREREWGLVV